MTTKMLKLRNQLKELAVTLKQTKVEHKKLQREGNSSGIITKVFEQKYEYRHKHIAYSILRGTERNKIEAPAKDNLANENYIKEIINEYTEVSQDVCASAA